MKKIIILLTLFAGFFSCGDGMGVEESIDGFANVVTFIIAVFVVLWLMTKIGKNKDKEKKD